MANGRCMMHGGKSLVGIGSQTLTAGGRYSKHLPTRLAGAYRDAEHDPNLLSLREEVKLLDSRLADVLASVSNQESGELWARLKAAKKQYTSARGKDAEEKKSGALSDMFWLIEEGWQESQNWAEVRSLIQERRTLVDSERGRLKDMQQMISAERASILLGAVTDVIRRNVRDPRTLAAIAAELGRIVSAGPREEP